MLASLLQRIKRRFSLTALAADVVTVVIAVFVVFKLLERWTQ